MFKAGKLLQDLNVTNMDGLFFLVQLCGEAFGSAWQFSEALTRRNADKNVHPRKRFHERQGKGNIDHRRWRPCRSCTIMFVMSVCHLPC